MSSLGRRRFPVAVSLLGALTAILASASPAAAAEFDKFGFKLVSASLTNHVAGAHPDFTTTLVAKTNPASPNQEFPYAALKDVEVALPPGLVGNLNAVDECSNAQFISGKNEPDAGCPFSAQVGISEVHLVGQSPGLYTKSPIFRLEPGPDTVARLGFMVTTVPVFIDVGVRSDDDYGVTAVVRNMSAETGVLEVKTTIWGVPADSSHDTLRFTPLEINQAKQESPPRPAGHPLAAFLTNPTSCTGPLSVGVAADSYQEPGRFVHYAASLGAITGCGDLDFEPALSLKPTSREASAPTGAEATLTLSQHEGWDERATAHLRDAVIELPEGVGINSGAADGLAACSAEQVGYRVSPPPASNCPDAAKIATAEIDSPSLTRPIEGAVYQRSPEPGHLFRAWLVADELGVHLKIPGEFELDPQSGQITSLFLDAPQLPLRELELHFKGGERGVLATPRRCGTYQTSFTFIPWSGNPAVQGTTPMTFDAGCDAGGFVPTLRAGTTNPLGGAFSPLVTELALASGSDNLSRLQVTMPPGLLAKVRGIPLCPEAAALSGACPSASLVGHATVASGFGPAPLWIPQPGKEATAIYLAGRYRGAPYSLLVRTPAQAGPFDLGDVVVRVALHVDPTTTQVGAVSDALPQTLEGVPISYRDVRVELDRPGFALNPTSCDPMAVSGQASAITGATAALRTRFQVGQCRRLAFKPKLRLRLRGRTRRASNPALSATLKLPRGGANIAWSRVTLPRSLQIDNAHINSPCTRVQFDAGACPKKSVLGHATATSPLLDRPLRGPVYFRSNGGERELPDLVADLRGQIHVVLVGYIDTKKARIRTTFGQVPDAPVSSFKLALFSGKRGLLEANRDLCRARNRAVVQFNGHNGKIADSKQKLAIAGCES
jgi:hypothetical protein